MIMNIEIKNTIFPLKYSFRGYIIYEELTEKSFDGGFKETIILFYSMIMASNKQLALEFDDFIDWLDENPDKLNEFTEWLGENIKTRNLRKDEKGSSETKKK